jgi:NAD(P)-dependent dehydrogenase (short-subunit alcohol dehydrogenase family)
VIGLTKAAALEYARDNIRVNVVCPGYIDTPMTVGEDSIFPRQKLQALVERTAIRRMADPNEVAEMVVWLSSNKASFVTGASFMVDGGASAG